MTQAALTAAGRVLLAGGRPLLAGAAAGGASGGASGLANVALISGGNQSNAGYGFSIDGAGAVLAQAASFYLGGTGAPAFFSAWGNAGTAVTDVSGIPEFEIATPTNFTMAFVSNQDATTTDNAFAAANVGNNSAAAADYATLAGEIPGFGPGTCGTGWLAYCAALTAAQRGQILAIVKYHGETAATEYNQISKQVYKNGVKAEMAFMRAALGKTAAQMPVLLVGPPYGFFPNNVTGSPTVRECWAEIAADAAQNAIFYEQTYDSISRNEAWNAATGVASGGNTDGGHRSAIDNVALFKRLGLYLARQILAANGLSVGLIPSGLGVGNGPQMTAAHLAGNTLTITVAHDGGNDLVVPLLAAQGVGFSVMDGGTIASPGPIILATGCTRVDATHLSVTLASAPANPAASCRLLYPWAGTTWAVQPDCEIGRGCAVTDNFASVAKPSGFDANASLGAGWAPNMPLRTPVSVSGSGVSAVATYGLALN